MQYFTSDGCSYTGMDEATVTRLRTELGRTTVYVDEATYNSIIAAQGK